MLDSISSYEPPEDSLTSMLLQKEKELQELSKLRINQLQDQIIFKDKSIFDLESQLRRLSEDNSYISNLLQQRNDEIKELEDLLQEKDDFPEIVENLKAQCIELKEKLSRSEECNREDAASQALFKELQEKLQEAYSLINKLKYDGQFMTEKFSEFKERNSELENLNRQLSEDIKSKESLIQKLLSKSEGNEFEIAELTSKLRQEKERCERELTLLRSKYTNEVRSIKEIKDSSTEQISFSHKIQLEKFQNQMKTLLEDNKKANSQVEYYQTAMLEKEKSLNQEVYALKKEITYKSQLVEELQANGRTKDIEIESIKEHIDHWKNLAISRADELFKFKQLQIRSEEKAENYLKELDAYKNESFNEIQKLKKELEKFLQDKRTKLVESNEENKIIKQLKEEMEKLNDLIYNKDKEISRLAMLLENLKKSNLAEDQRKAQQVEVYEPAITEKYPRSGSRDVSYSKPSRNKISQIKNKLDKKFLQISSIKF